LASDWDGGYICAFLLADAIQEVLFANVPINVEHNFPVTAGFSVSHFCYSIENFAVCRIHRLARGL
jgi:hypothetical protein